MLFGSTYIYTFLVACVLGSNCVYSAGVKYTPVTERSKLKSMARYEILFFLHIMSALYVETFVAHLKRRRCRARCS